MTYQTVCDECGGYLELASCVCYNIRDVPIFASGFSITDARGLDTSDEIVRCVECGRISPLEELED